MSWGSFVIGRGGPADWGHSGGGGFLFFVFCVVVAGLEPSDALQGWRCIEYSHGTF